MRAARSADHREGDAFDEDGDDQEGAAEQSEDAEGEEPAKDAILEGCRRAESAELGGDPNGDVDSDQRSDDPEGRRVVDPGRADQRCGGKESPPSRPDQKSSRSREAPRRGQNWSEGLFVVASPLAFGAWPGG